MEADTKTKVTAECKCGKKEIDIEPMLDEHGFFASMRQCMRCTQVVKFTVEEA